MKVTVIGSAASGSQLGRESSGYLLQNRAGEERADIMLDFGPALGTLDGYLNPAALGSIIVTHEHPDHTNGFAHLLVRRFWNEYLEARKAFFEGRRGEYPRIPVYGPPGLRETLLSQVNKPDALTLEEAANDPHADCQLIGEEAIDELLEFRSLAQLMDGRGIDIKGGFRLTAVRARHPVEAFSVRLDHPRMGSLCYTGDTGPSPQLTALATGVDLLIYNAPGAAIGAGGRQMHSSPAEAGQCATDAGVKNLLLGHLNAGLHSLEWAKGRHIREQLLEAHSTAWRAVEAHAIRGARSTFNGRVLVATPGLRVEFGQGRPLTVRDGALGRGRMTSRNPSLTGVVSPLRSPMNRRARTQPGNPRRTAR